jgi:DNA helicase-2/ATP-dependent DNA helicase PcrA
MAQKIIKPTIQQQTFTGTAVGTDSVALRARAGTGKTTSLGDWGKEAKKGGLATSFSKSTVVELGKKMPSKFQSQTMHALGMQVIRNSGNFVEMTGSKVFDLTKMFAEEHEIKFEDQEPIRKLVALAKTMGIQPDQNGPEGLVSREHYNWVALADQFDIEMPDLVYEAARDILTISNRTAIKDGIIDFDDMLYIPLIYPKHRFPRYPIILADEVQDFNSLQHLMLKRLLLPNGRLIAAGDDRQAIYGFRGALADSYTQLVSDFSMTELPLTVSFRCPKAVVYEAQKYVPDIEVSPDAIEGSVSYPEHLALADIPSSVLCRNNAPLIRLALGLLVEGRTVEVAGQDIGKGLISLTKRITKKNLSSDEFQDRIDKWKEREIARKPKHKSRITDKHSALVALARHHKDLKGIQQHLASLYPNPNDRSYKPAEIQLSTIHRAKGREWPKVLFLDPQLIPSKYSKSDSELLQEDNLAYVGVTRAQEELIYCPTANIEGLEGEDV